jgi:acyl carrier protein
VDAARLPVHAVGLPQWQLRVDAALARLACLVFQLRRLRTWSQSLDVIDTKSAVLAILEEALGLEGRSGEFDLDTPLLGAVPELDSMAVVGVINLLEERFDFIVEDDELDGSTFATLGSLLAFVDAKLGR